MFSVVSLFLRVFCGLCLHADFSVGTPRGGAFSLTPHGGEAEHAGIKRFAPQHRKTVPHGGYAMHKKSVCGCYANNYVGGTVLRCRLSHFLTPRMFGFASIRG